MLALTCITRNDEQDEMQFAEGETLSPSLMKRRCNEDIDDRTKRRRCEIPSNYDMMSRIAGSLFTKPYTLSALPTVKNQFSTHYSNLFAYLGDDVMFRVIAHLFESPLFFNGAVDGASITATSKYYKPSFNNRFSLKDVGSLLRTCHYTNTVLGTVIRRNKPRTNRVHCTRCQTRHTKCKDCHVSCCATCNANEMIQLKCHGCETPRLLCPCRDFLIWYPGVPCLKCKNPLTIHNVTHRPLK